MTKGAVIHRHKSAKSTKSSSHDPHFAQKTKMQNSFRSEPRGCLTEVKQHAANHNFLHRIQGFIFRSLLSSHVRSTSELKNNRRRCHHRFSHTHIDRIEFGSAESESGEADLEFGLVGRVGGRCCSKLVYGSFRK